MNAGHGGVGPGAGSRGSQTPYPSPPREATAAEVWGEGAEGGGDVEPRSSWKSGWENLSLNDHKNHGFSRADGEWRTGGQEDGQGKTRKQTHTEKNTTLVTLRGHRKVIHTTFITPLNIHFQSK